MSPLYIVATWYQLQISWLKVKIWEMVSIQDRFVPGTYLQHDINSRSIRSWYTFATCYQLQIGSFLVHICKMISTPDRLVSGKYLNHYINFTHQSTEGLIIERKFQNHRRDMCKHLLEDTIMQEFFPKMSPPSQMANAWKCRIAFTESQVAIALEWLISSPESNVAIPVEWRIAPSQSILAIALKLQLLVGQDGRI